MTTEKPVTRLQVTPGHSDMTTEAARLWAALTPTQRAWWAREARKAG